VWRPPRICSGRTLVYHLAAIIATPESRVRFGAVIGLIAAFISGLPGSAATDLLELDGNT